MTTKVKTPFDKDIELWKRKIAELKGSSHSQFEREKLRKHYYNKLDELEYELECWLHQNNYV